MSDPLNPNLRQFDDYCHLSITTAVFSIRCSDYSPHSPSRGCHPRQILVLMNLLLAQPLGAHSPPCPPHSPYTPFRTRRGAFLPPLSHISEKYYALLPSHINTIWEWGNHWGYSTSRRIILSQVFCASLHLQNSSSTFPLVCSCTVWVQVQLSPEFCKCSQTPLTWVYHRDETHSNQFPVFCTNVNAWEDKWSRHLLFHDL